MNLPTPDLTYQTFGHWMVLEHAGVDKKYTQLWKCQCSCGSIVNVRAPSLLLNKSTKCVKCRNQNSANKRKGIVRKLNIASPETKQSVINEYILGSSIKTLSSKFSVPEKTIYDWLKKNNIEKNKKADLYHKVYSDYKWGAKSRGIEFVLSREEIYRLIVQNCYYCGVPPFNCRNTYKDVCFYNGIDRIDSGAAYIISNVVPCCAICNIAKNDMSIEKFKLWVQRIYNYTFEQGDKCD